MSLQERVFGLETEYAINFYTSDNQSKPEPRLIVQTLQEALMQKYGISGCDYLVTGAKFHHDVGHAEWAQPECRTAREIAAYDKAADALLAQVLPAAQQALEQEGYHGQLLIAKNNVDSAGNTYGCHENYLMLRDTELLTGEHFLRYLIRCLIPFLVTRQLFAGAGRLVSPIGGRSQQATFEISQRAAFIDTIVSPQTTKERPIFNLGREDEPLAAGNYRRLHQILGDANLSGWATWMKMGTMAIVLRMIEDLFLVDNPLFQNSLAALRTISRDPSCRVLLPMRAGKRMSALDIQWFYYERADAYLDEFGCSDEENALMEEWETALQDLSEDPMKLRNRADWAIKKRFLDAYLAQAGVSWATATDTSITTDLQAYDLRYHDVSGEGLYSQFYKPDTLLSQIEIQTAQQQPPPYTRARIRGEAIRTAQKYHFSVHVGNWQEVQVDNVKITLDNPLEFDNQHFAASWDTPILRLEKACEQDPNNAEKYCDLGLLYLEEELYKKALQAFFKAVKLQPEDRYYTEHVALTLLHLGFYEEAIQWYKKTNWLMEDRKFLRYNSMGSVYLCLGRYEEAREAFSQQILLNPESRDAVFAHDNMGVLLLVTGQIAEAEKQFDSVLELHPDQCVPLVLSGTIKLSCGDTAQAQVLLNAAVALPQNTVAGETKSTFRYYQAIAHIGLKSTQGLSLLQEALKYRHPPAASGLMILKPSLNLLARAPHPPRAIQQALAMVRQAEDTLPQTSQSEPGEAAIVSESEHAWWKELVTHKDVYIRMRTATYLSWRKSSLALALLQQMAQHDGDEKVRIAAIKALSTIEDKDTAANILITCLDDPTSAVRWTAQEALEEMNWGNQTRSAPVPSSGPDDGEQLIQLLS